MHMNSLQTHWQSSIKEGLLIKDGQRWKLTNPKGMELCNQVLIQMMVWWNSIEENSVLSPKTEVLQYKVADQESRP